MVHPQHIDLESDDSVEPGCVVPSLQSLCVRVIGAHLNSIDSLGTMPYDIVKPILEDKRCTPDILRKFELNSPHLKEYDQEIWRKFYLEKYPEKLEQHSKGEFPVKSWRKLYTQSVLDDEEKLKSAASRLREAKERKANEKKGRQLQLTDKVPPAKRARWGESAWGAGPSKPKTLLEKARTQTKRASTVYRSAGGPSSTFPSRFPPTSISSTTSASPVSSRLQPSTSSGTPSRTAQRQVHGQLLHEHMSAVSPPMLNTPARRGLGGSPIPPLSTTSPSSSSSPTKHVSRTLPASAKSSQFSTSIPDLVFSQGPPGGGFGRR